MRIKKLNLKNIATFKEGEIDFIGNNNNPEKPPITIITGENGTGKTIILDAIRGLLLGQFNNIERNIVRDENDFFIKGDFLIPQILNKRLQFTDISINTQKIKKNAFITLNLSIGRKLARPTKEKTYWITNYWTSGLSNDSFNIKSLVAPKAENYLLNSLNGIQSNVEVTQLICFFDYLRSSMSESERELGEFLYNLLKKIMKLSLIDGEFKYVERQTLTPIIHQTGGDISLDKLSSGNLYLIQRLISLLGQMYSVHILNNTKIDELCNVPGLLLIDEAENHLHPKWQKTFLNSVTNIFPNLQIIVTTHSPFIVSSVKNANVYVCKSMEDHSIIENKTEEYSNKPIEEILISPVFNTHNFNADITELIIKRKLFIQNKETEKANEIAKELLRINPEYFSYFEIENIINKISK